MRILERKYIFVCEVKLRIATDVRRALENLLHKNIAARNQAQNCLSTHSKYQDNDLKRRYVPLSRWPPECVYTCDRRPEPIERGYEVIFYNLKFELHK